MFIPDEKATMALGEKLSLLCAPHCIVFLYGNLGAGKTTFARGFLRGLGYQGKVKSPTYTIVEPYEINKKCIYHFDLYRLHDVRELEFIGIDDYFNAQTICLIEWPEKGEGVLPLPDLSCYFEPCGEGREIKIVGNTEWGNDILERFQHENS